MGSKMAVKMWKKEEIRTMLDENNRAALRGLAVIHSLQTESEKASRSAQIWNGVGWSGVDAEIMTNLYEWHERYGRFSQKQWALVHRKIRRYAGQLTKVANGEIVVTV